MDDKQAAEILIKLQKKDHLLIEEKEALAKAIGVLTWTALAESRLKKMRKNK